MDCFQKIRQQIKCHLQQGGPKELAECLDVIESTNLTFFTKDMTAEFYAIKGLLLAKSNRPDEANKAFSASVQLFDTLAKGWSLWGEYLEGVFVQHKDDKQLGVAAIACFLNACRHQNESKSRKYLAKVSLQPQINYPQLGLCNKQYNFPKINIFIFQRQKKRIVTLYDHCAKFELEYKSL